MVCNGKNDEICGGPNRLSLYEDGNVLPSQSAGGPASTGNVNPPQQTSPTQPATVGGTWTWYGCQAEATGARALAAETYASDDMTLESCATFCSGYQYFGVEYARECYCGNTFSAGSAVAPAADCSFPCAGSSAELCGAGNRLLGLQQRRADAAVGLPHVLGPAGTSSYRTANRMVLPRLLDRWLAGPHSPDPKPDSQTNTPASCAQKCSADGYSISGVEYGVQCFCGNALYNGATKVADTDCSTACPGDATQKCRCRQPPLDLRERPASHLRPPGPVDRKRRLDLSRLRRGQYQRQANPVLAVVFPRCHDTSDVPEQVRRIRIHGRRSRVRRGVLLR